MGQHIVAMGGGGFSMDSGNALLDDYVLGLCRRSVPRVGFLPTASGDASEYIERFYDAFGTVAETSHLRLFPAPNAEPAAWVAHQDVIYVGGGSTANLLAVWRVHGLDSLLAHAWRDGIVLCGLSAGGMCWFEGGITDSFGPLRPLHDGLGILAGSFTPHFDGEEPRQRALVDALADGLPAGYGVDDGAALHFEGTSLARVVASRAGSIARQFSMVDGRVEETKLEARILA